MIQHFKLPIEYEKSYAYTRDEANLLAESGFQGEIIDTIISKYKNLEEQFDFTIIEGSDFLGEGTAFEFDANVTIAKNLGTPVIIVLSGDNKNVAQVCNSAIVTINNFLQRKVKVLAVVVNKVDESAIEEIKNTMGQHLPDDIILSNIPKIIDLKSPSMKEVKEIGGRGDVQGITFPTDHFIFVAIQISIFSTISMSLSLPR